MEQNKAGKKESCLVKDKYHKISMEALLRVLGRHFSLLHTVSTDYTQSFWQNFQHFAYFILFKAFFVNMIRNFLVSLIIKKKL
ncbi:hypothetical protein DB44_DN00040 [Candidatus Protochlamydia amoebophila]|uniref:Uncharacterized protein n=1 Tax=Candidatus Protochlamydia amoebophila TaxID=362787 RepID=A0A0C1H154_9BACT|nr:hypothetical protein DB44_DN00040 [Candidatus Protochlamydia amoebophila]